MGEGPSLKSAAGRRASTAAPAASSVAAPVDQADAPAPGSWATLWLTDRDIVVFTGLAATLLVLLVVRWGQLSGWGAQEIEIERLTPLEHRYRLDLNAATWVELAQLENVGETLALRIVEDREVNGPFRTIDDLDRVKGIGPKTLERLRTYVRVSVPDPEP